MEVKTCIACGMPMSKPTEYAMGDVTKAYCVYCARQDGTMQSYNEKLESLTRFIVRTQGLDEGAASIGAKTMMARLPAWKDRPQD
jgi:hypothetical protein